MALVAVAIYDTPENGREVYTERFLDSIMRPKITDHLDARHTFVFVINAATPKTLDNLAEFSRRHRYPVQVITMPENVGTARAINQAWKLRQPGENAVKMDNDIEIIAHPSSPFVTAYPWSSGFGTKYSNPATLHAYDWLEKMEEALQRDPKIGPIGLKRKDCCQHPSHPDEFYRSTLHIIPENPIPGHPWMVVEKTADVMGTCTMFSSACLDAIGYLWQPGLYGFDDVMACERVRKAGFDTAFLHGIEIDHIDNGGNEYQKWKERSAMMDSPTFHEAREAVREGRLPVYVPADYDKK